MVCSECAVVAVVFCCWLLFLVGVDVSCLLGVAMAAVVVGAGCCLLL